MRQVLSCWGSQVSAPPVSYCSSSGLLVAITQIGSGTPPMVCDHAFVSAAPTPMASTNASGTLLGITSPDPSQTEDLSVRLPTPHLHLASDKTSDLVCPSPFIPVELRLLCLGLPHFCIFSGCSVYRPYHHFYPILLPIRRLCSLLSRNWPSGHWPSGHWPSHTTPGCTDLTASFLLPLFPVLAAWWSSCDDPVTNLSGVQSPQDLAVAPRPLEKCSGCCLFCPCAGPLLTYCGWAGRAWWLPEWQKV